ncbi:hypothetical protein ABZY31_27580 [Streptomyces sp. NPDC006529]|uniref:hypothetical protein n=1 Tax=Streptomyces sp. NPDC006529 TaxID=3157177 RepID=UPI0033BD4907
MHRQDFARLEQEALRTSVELNEIGHAARPTADLDDVAAPHVGRCDLDLGGK